VPNNEAARRVQHTYLLLTLLSTLAASFIWGVNTLFLLDAGLDNAGAFAANAFFTAGEVIFEVPTGVVADTWGRRTSYLLGAVTLLAATLLYLAMWRVHAPLWGWGLASVVLGLGFTFFSGATEAWLVDALAATGFEGTLESVMARGQSVSGVAMLTGAVGGGLLAQATNLGVPYLVRSVLLGLTLVVAFVRMKDLGFTPTRGKRLVDEVKAVLRASLDGGWRNPPVRWLMVASVFVNGVTIYAFYALQPHLLRLYGNPRAFGVAGLSAAIIAATQIMGGLVTPYVRTLFSRRTHALLATVLVAVACQALIARTSSFGLAIALVTVWGLAFSISQPMRQAYLNGIIPSGQRATVLSFDNLMGSAGGVVTQPALGRLADVAGYPASYLACAIIQAGAVPFMLLARRENAASDPIAETAP
jgi:MFS family permease